MKYRKYLLVAAALLVIGAASVKPAMAYFTDTQKATGEVTISLGDSKLTPEENVTGMTKIITVTNSGDHDVFVRVKAIHGSNITDDLGSDSTGWSYDGTYYVYSSSLAPGEAASELRVDIGVTEELSETFNVVIVEEATKTLYDANGNAYADWSDEANTVMSREEYDAKFGVESTPETVPVNNESDETQNEENTENGEDNN